MNYTKQEEPSVAAASDAYQITNPVTNTPNSSLQEAFDKIKNSNFLSSLSQITNNMGLSSNTNEELQKLSSSTKGIIDNIKDRIISKLESEKIQNIIKASSNEFGKRLGILGNAFLINDNPYADVFFSIKSVFDLLLYEFFNILLFINIIVLNNDENVAISNFNSNISKSHILDDFLMTILSSVKSFSKNILQSLKIEAFSIIFKHYKTDEKHVQLLTNLSTEILDNTIERFFEIFYKNLNSRQSAKQLQNTQSAPPPATMFGGKLKRLKTKKQKILKRINTYLANFHNTKHNKSKTLKRRSRRSK